MRARGRHAFTLVELLVVIAVLAVLAALLFPVFARARESGRQAVCLNNLSQLGKAFALYSDGWDGQLPPILASSPVGGPPDGLPIHWTRALSPAYVPRAVFYCPSGSNPVLSEEAVRTMEAQGLGGDLDEIARSESWWLRAAVSYAPGAWTSHHPGDEGASIAFEEPRDKSGTVLLADQRGWDVTGTGWRWACTGPCPPGCPRCHPLFEHLGGRVPLLFHDGHVASLPFTQTFSPRFLWWDVTDTPEKERILLCARRHGLLPSDNAPPLSHVPH